MWAENRQLEGSCDECRDLHGDEAEEYTNEEQVEAQQIYHGHGEASGQAHPSPWGFASVGEVDSESGEGDGSVGAEETVSEPDAGELALENDDDESIHLSELEPPTDDDDQTDNQIALVNQPDAAMRQHPYILRMDELAAQMRNLQRDVVEVEGLADLMNYRDIPNVSDMTPFKCRNGLRLWSVGICLTLDKVMREQRKFQETLTSSRTPSTAIKG